MGSKFTRRRLLAAMSAGATYLALTNTVGCELLGGTSKDRPLPDVPSSRAQTFRSRPDLDPPAVNVTTRAHDIAPGYIFVATKMGGAGQGGPIILDDHGQVVWFRPVQDGSARAIDFKVQYYRGRPVLTLQEDEFGVLFNTSYREVARVRAGNGYRVDHHEFLITPQDTALLTINDPVLVDLSPVGGPKNGVIRQGIVQELDIETGEVLFEWHSLDHVGVDETYIKQSRDHYLGIDYFHINSIDVDHDENLLVSARNTSAVYKIDRQSGEVIWRLGGKKTDFEMGPGTRFSYQHDARRQPDDAITIFDNGTTVFDNNGIPRVVEESRSIVLKLDEEKMTAVLEREYTHPEQQFAHAAGNMQVLPNGNVFVGWGRALVFSEFSKSGELLFSASFPPGFSPSDGSYRVFRFPWTGHPSDKPAVAAKRTSEDEVEVYASWNGATEVTTWEVLVGPRPDQLESVGSVPRDGFETTMLVRTAEPYVGVRAKQRSGQVLGSSEPAKL
ncbi:MAG: arylsulfotransferase family protein [Rubrobacteraceae bacterium]